MPAKIDPELCDGCRGNPTPPCVRVCPGDVLIKDFNRHRSCVRDAAECWDCYACVKECPRNAIQVELPYVLARRSGGLDLLEHNGSSVLWQIRWADGRVQELRRTAHQEVFEDVPVDPDLYAARDI